MSPIDVIRAPWAIRRENLEEIIRVYDAHLRGESPDFDVAATGRRPHTSEDPPFENVDGVAILGLEGPIIKKANLFSRVSGLTSSQIFGHNFRAALADPEVHSIIISADSPGGTVDGTEELAALIYGARGEKPVVAFADGLMASAAYWIGSAADRIYLASRTTEVGSIGVVATHVDYSEADRKAGVRVTEITAGRYKRIASDTRPLSDEGRAEIQRQVDSIYSVFVDEVAKHRGTDPESVLEHMADGRIFIGHQAINAGLADGFSTLSALVGQLNEERVSGSVSLPAGAFSLPGGSTMPVEPTATVQTETTFTQADLDVAVAEAEARGREAGLAAGAEAERARIREVRDQSLAGHDDLIEALMFDGTTTGAEAARQVLAAERERREARGAALVEDAPEALPASVGTETAAPSRDSMSTVDRCRADWDANRDGVREEFKGDYAGFLAYTNAAESGRARILGRK